MRRLVRFLIFTLILAAISFGGWQGYLAFTAPKGFPSLPAGAYFGSLSGVYSPADAAQRLFVRHDAEQHRLTFIWLAEEARVIEVEFDTALFASEVRPLEIPIEGGKLAWSGAQLSNGVYHGKVRDSNSERTGRWEIRLLDSSIAEPAIDLRERLIAYAERSRMEERIRTAEDLIPAQKAEIEQLAALIQNDAELKRRAGDHRERAADEIGSARKTLEQKNREAELSEKQLELARRIHGQGKLVALARETLERENRWVESMLNAPGGLSADEFAAAQSRASELFELQEALELERRRISELVAVLEERPQ